MIEYYNKNNEISYRYITNEVYSELELDQYDLSRTIQIDDLDRFELLQECRMMGWRCEFLALYVDDILCGIILVQYIASGPDNSQLRVHIHFDVINIRKGYKVFDRVVLDMCKHYSVSKFYVYEDMISPAAIKMIDRFNLSKFVEVIKK